MIHYEINQYMYLVFPRRERQKTKSEVIFSLILF